MSSTMLLYVLLLLEPKSILHPEEKSNQLKRPVCLSCRLLRNALTKLWSHLVAYTNKNEKEELNRPEQSY